MFTIIKNKSKRPQDLTQYPYTDPEKQPPKPSPREFASANMIRCWRVEFDALQALYNALRTPAPLDPSTEFMRELRFMMQECSKRL